MSDWMKKQYEDAKPFLIGGIAIVICAAFMYAGANIATRNADRERETAVREAIATFEPSPLSCQEDNMIKGIRKLAENGAHLHNYDLWVYWSNKEEGE